MINVQENPLKNLTFPSKDFDHFRFIQWLETEMLENNHYLENPEATKADRVFSDHIKALNLSKDENMLLDEEYGDVLSTHSRESFVNGYLTAVSIMQGKVL